MSLVLRDNLEFCISGGRAVFLDLDTGRYFALADRHFAAFQHWTSGETSSEENPGALDHLASRGILIETDKADVRRKSSFSGLTSPTARFRVSQVRASPASVGSAIFSRLVWSRRVKYWPFARLVESVRQSDLHNRTSPTSIELSWIIRSFEIADIIIGNHDRCLERSLALAVTCRRHGIPNTLVLGIQANPFAAHCWVQDQSFILNDHPDRVSMFTPILAV